MHSPLARGRGRGWHTAVVAFALTAVCAAPASAAKLPPLPHGWPKTLQIGLTDPPGDAKALHRSAPFGMRYQYLAGGVNTGSGWSTWNPDGSFVSMYVAESRAAHEIPVFSYYQLLQSKPGGGGEAQADLANLKNPDTMQAYWADLTLFFQRAAGPKPVVLHVEPDLWGYIEQASKNDDAASVPAVVPDGLPQNAAGFAQEIVKLRDRLAPNVILAYHMSGWGTQHDVAFEDPPDRTVVAYATRSAAFYRSLGAAFDLSFEDFSDRDSGYYEKVRGDVVRVVQAGGLPPPPPVRPHLRPPCRHPHGRVADPARQHRDARDERHHGPLPGQPRAVAARRRERPEAPARVREGRIRRLPVRRRRRARRRAPATGRRTASRIPIRSTGTRDPRCRPTTTAGSSGRS